MKKILTFLSILFGIFIYSQAASKINNAQNILTTNSNPPNFLGADGLPDVTLLGIEVLLAATTNVNGATVDILVTEK